MEIERIIVGEVTAAAGVWRCGDPTDRPVTIPVPAYLIDTGDERILVDTGLHPAAAADAGSHYDGAPSLGFFALGQEAGLADQLDLASITRVVLTHLHFDHAGGLALLPGTVPIVVQRREWEAAHDEEAIARNFFLPIDYAGVADQVVLVDGDHDVLGDGTVELLLTPGHTPGHQSVRVGDHLVIGGDVTHYSTGLDDLRFPAFGDDPDAQAASAMRLRALRDAGARVLPGHDPQAVAAGPIALGG